MRNFTLTLFALVFMAFVAQADELTICDGNAECQYSPFYGLKMADGYLLCQSIYPADKLIDMKDKWITAVKFYPVDAFGNFAQANLQLALMEVEQDHFESTTMLTGATVVALYGPIPGETELVFYLNEPFKYNGGNLLVQTQPKSANFSHSTKFKGEATNQVTSMARYKKDYWSSEYIYETETNLPKATFTYETDSMLELIETCTPPMCGYAITNLWEATVYLSNEEVGATVYYWISRDDHLIKKGSFTGDSYKFSVLGIGEYKTVAIAKKEGMYDSPNDGVFFTIWNEWIPEAMRGDVNMDENVNMDDLTDLINYLVTDDATRVSFTNADCDPNGKVNMDDLTTLIDYLLTNQWPD